MDRQLVVLGSIAMLISVVMTGFAYGPSGFGKQYRLPNTASRIIIFVFGLLLTLLGVFGDRT